ncbi:MAG: M48 family metalloprotease, partial [Acidobacteriota bacterium]|nr:M48 family metalloprotease [Acidobacteriota bacterium]
MTDLSGWVPPLVLALAPGGVKLWIDRSLARRLDDPALPERLMARRSRMAMVVAVPLAVTVLLWPARLPWSGPLLIAAFVAAGFPLRRRLHGETWSLPSYLWFMLRWTVATWGFWLLLVCAPVLADRAGWQGWAAAGAVAAVLLSWNERFADVLRFAARARPVDRPDLLVRFEALVARTQLATPRFDEVPLRGGVVANALALPSVGGAGVLFTETLLNRFTADEVTAVCAHELAHLEYFNPERVRRMRLRGALLILV